MSKSDSIHISYTAAENVTKAINTRRSIRAFLPDEVPLDLVNGILETASRAPSGTNIQPWKVYVLTGSVKEKLCAATSLAFDEQSPEHKIEVPYYPDKWFEPYISRRRKIGWDFYGLLGIQKGEKERMHAQHRRNYELFDAPIGMMFTIHRDLSTGSWMDYGMFLQNVMLLAREQGLHTCPQAAWNEYPAVIRQQLNIDDSEQIVCGMALGYADPAATENELVSERAPLSEFVTVL